MLGLDNPIHILFLLVVLLLVFGAKRLPELGRSLGSGIRGFKETISVEQPRAEFAPGPAARAESPLETHVSPAQSSEISTTST
jgi:sec-independent protein translocase protein TatA